MIYVLGGREEQAGQACITKWSSLVLGNMTESSLRMILEVDILKTLSSNKQTIKHWDFLRLKKNHMLTEVGKTDNLYSICTVTYALGHK